MRDRPNRRPHDQDRGSHADQRADGLTIFGIHAVEAALANANRRIAKLYLTDNAERRLTEALSKRQIAHERVLPRELDRRLGPDTVHQGALIEAAALPEPSLAELVEASAGRPLIVLDQVTDPHNVGAILRSASAFAVKAVITTARHSPEATGVLAKSASGALDIVPIVTVANLARGLTELKERGYLVVGLDSEGETSLSQAPLREPLALVLGAEGKGLRQLTRQTCDIRARLDLPGAIKSLNVSNAAAVALYAAAAALRDKR
jgi:23S rRNA (guanosine2251-2'-O)-methyltransferase